MNVQQAKEFVATVPQGSLVYWAFSVFDALGVEYKTKYIVCANDVKYIPTYIKYHCNGFVVNKTISIIGNGTNDYLQQEFMKHGMDPMYNSRIYPAFGQNQGTGTICSPSRIISMQEMIEYINDNVDRDIPVI